MSTCLDKQCVSDKKNIPYSPEYEHQKYVQVHMCVQHVVWMWTIMQCFFYIYNH